MGTYTSKYTGEQIDNLLGQVENGGAGGSTSKATLWEGELSATGNVTLSDSLDNYDFIYVSGSATVNGKANSVTSTIIIDVSSIIYGTSDYLISVISGSTSAKYGVHFRLENNSTLKLLSVNATSWTSPVLNKVVGIKL